ncbi:MAG: hypothetical protein B7733_09255 [Myxococcales bacterium FL481]|nr:MAG: hypothetical protein B7733_09255 [Myxococcales bacterium FL481]
MWRPWLQTARPADWRGTLAWLGVFALTAMFLFAAVAARLPGTWVAAAGGSPWIVRATLVLIVLWLARWCAALVYAMIPGTPVVAFGRLRMRARGRFLQLHRDELADVWVERRPYPAGETIVVRGPEPRTYDVCPLDWPGAEHVYRQLSRWLR